MIKTGPDKIRYISYGSTPALAMRVGNKCVYPYNGLYSSDVHNDPLFYYKSFPPITATTNIGVASPHPWGWGQTLVVSDGYIIDKESDTSPFLYNIPYIKPSHTGNVRWDCFIDYTNTTENIYSFPMCSFYVTEGYFLQSSVATATVTFNFGSGICKFTIQMPYEIATTYELSFPSILNYLDTVSNYKWPVKINRTMFNATIY